MLHKPYPLYFFQKEDCSLLWLVESFIDFWHLLMVFFADTKRTQVAKCYNMLKISRLFLTKYVSKPTKEVRSKLPQLYTQVWSAHYMKSKLVSLFQLIIAVSSSLINDSLFVVTWINTSCVVQVVLLRIRYVRGFSTTLSLRNTLCLAHRMEKK